MDPTIHVGEIVSVGIVGATAIPIILSHYFYMDRISKTGKQRGAAAIVVSLILDLAGGALIVVSRRRRSFWFSFGKCLITLAYLNIVVRRYPSF